MRSNNRTHLIRFFTCQLLTVNHSSFELIQIQTNWKRKAEWNPLSRTQIVSTIDNNIFHFKFTLPPPPAPPSFSINKFIFINNCNSYLMSSIQYVQYMLERLKCNTYYICALVFVIYWKLFTSRECVRSVFLFPFFFFSFYVVIRNCNPNKMHKREPLKISLNSE